MLICSVAPGLDYFYKVKCVSQNDKTDHVFSNYEVQSCLSKYIYVYLIMNNKITEEFTTEMH